MSKGRAVLGLLGVVAAVGVARHMVANAGGRPTPGGILIRGPGAYDVFSRRLLGSFFAGIAADVAGSAPEGARILEVGCGPGHLAIRLARHGLEVTGVDLDPIMVERARANAMQLDQGRPEFHVGDAARLDFPDQSFDLVVSTLSLHHWADPRAGLSEIARVLRHYGRALIWDLRPGHGLIHHGAPDPVEHIQGTPLRLVGATSWRWPGRLALTQRTELARS